MMRASGRTLGDPRRRRSATAGRTEDASPARWPGRAAANSARYSLERLRARPLAAAGSAGACSRAKNHGSLSSGMKICGCVAEHLVQRRRAALGVPDDEEVGHAPVRLHRRSPARASPPSPLSRGCHSPTATRSRPRYSLSAATSRLKRRRSSPSAARRADRRLTNTTRRCASACSAPRRSRRGRHRLDRALTPRDTGPRPTETRVDQLVQALRARAHGRVGLARRRSDRRRRRSRKRSTSRTVASLSARKSS